ncbi:MAG: hypothetical protein HY907_03230 [Deltaproteobacteria bacterium]|nr:hypothetical protein [Deltaproteobacteria bacterium]
MRPTRPALLLVAALVAACGPSREEWQAQLDESQRLRVELEQRDWQRRSDQERIAGLVAEQERLQRTLAELQARYDEETARLRRSVESLQAVVDVARRQAAEQAAYPTALLDGSPLPEAVGPREVATPPINVRRLGLEWHFRSSHGGEATVSFSAGVRDDLSGYCTMCTIWVRAACTSGEVTLTDVRAIAETEHVMDMGAGDTAEMSSSIFRHAPLDSHPERCDLTVSLAETSDEGGGVLLGRFCWTDDGEVRDRACR